MMLTDRPFAISKIMFPSVVWDETWMTSAVCSTGLLALIITTFIILVYITDSLIRIPWIPDVKKKYVLVTGCDTGFGRSLLENLVSLRCHTFAGCFTEAGFKEASKLPSKFVTPIRLDVSSSQSIQNAYNKVTSSLPCGKNLWCLVNNAGVSGSLGPGAWFTRSDYQQVLDVNLLGTIEMTNTFLPLIKKSKGRIVNMVSSLGRLGIPYSGSYCVSKFALEGYSDVLRRELMVFGVSVHIIEPGGHTTGLTNVQNIANLARAAWYKIPLHMQDEYGPDFFNELLHTGTTMVQLVSSPNLQKVINSYTHAMFARRPRSRYLVGWDGHAYVFLSYLPDWLSDSVFTLLGMQPKPAVCKTNK